MGTFRQISSAPNLQSYQYIVGVTGNRGTAGDRGTGQCPGWFKIVFEIFEMVFLPIPVSRWS